jgi:DNA-binding response OmpR family regulator
MATLLKRALEEQQCSVQLSSNGPDGLQVARSFPFDVITLDVMLPGMDGFEVARELRRCGIATPILFLTARDSKVDIALGLDLGGDDYLTKPFSFIELLARLRALARRKVEVPSDKLRVADLVLDTATREVTRGGRPIELSRTEYLLLEIFMRNTGHVLMRQALFSAVWGTDHSVVNNTLDVFIRLLRRKIDDGYSTKLIQTIRGFGYLMDERQPG